MRDDDKELERVNISTAMIPHPAQSNRQEPAARTGDCPTCGLNPVSDCVRGIMELPPDNEYAGAGLACPNLLKLAGHIQQTSKAAYVRSFYPMPQRCKGASLKDYPKYLYAPYQTAQGIVEGVLNGTLAKGPIQLRGEYGSGKTHLACAIGNEFRRKGFSIAFAAASTLISKLQSCYGRDVMDTANEILEAAMQADYLILDDIGKHGQTDYSDSRLYEIVDTRYREQRPIIVTANDKIALCKDKELEKAIGERLKEGSQVIRMPEGSLRKRQEPYNQS